MTTKPATSQAVALFGDLDLRRCGGGFPLWDSAFRNSLKAYSGISVILDIFVLLDFRSVIVTLV